MSWGVVAKVGIAVGSSVLSNNRAKKDAKKARNAQSESERRAAEEREEALESTRKLFEPYIAAGNAAVGAQNDLLGLNGNVPQQAAINQIEGSVRYDTLLKAGENALNQNASATGGLRGGNNQRALLEYRPTLLNKLIQQKFDNLGALATLGQNSAAGQGTHAMNTGNLNAEGQQNIGAYNSGAILQNGAANANLTNQLGTIGTGLVTNYLNGRTGNSGGSSASDYTGDLMSAWVNKQ
jgi:hypothetical protein